MNKAIEWFAHNPVAANLLMILILVSGGMSLMTSKQEVMPELPLEMISITVPYLGAAPEEVEEAVCVRIEESISGLDGVKKVTSTAAEGFGQVIVKMRPGTDSARLLADIKNRVDAIESFPQETEKPIIEELTSQMQVIDIAVSGNTDEESLQKIAERIRDEVVMLDGVTHAQVLNPKEREIDIQVSEDDLRRHGITFNHVAGAVRTASLDLPGGSVKTNGGEILLRTAGQAREAIDFERLPLLTRPDGTRLLLGEVATIRDTFAESDLMSTLNGKPCVVVEIFRVGDQGALDIADQVFAYLPQAQASLPEGILLTPWLDQTKVLEDRLSTLSRNGLQGLLLVFLLLAMFLKFRLAMWVSLGIPVAFLGTFWILPWFDVSINLVSLFAFIVVLGIVVDDAIIVGESIYSHQEKHGDGMRGAIEGTKDVLVPVTFGILTTIMAFVPMLGVEGVVGKFFRQVPIVVIGCLVFSFIESKLILPRHLSHISDRGERKNPWQRFQNGFANLMKRFVHQVYRPFLKKALRLRYLTIAAGLAFFFLTMGMIGAGWVGFNYMDNVESDFVSVAITMPQGTPVEKTHEAVAQAERGIDQLQAELAEQGYPDLIKLRFATVGTQPFVAFQNYNAGVFESATSSSNLGEVSFELVPAELRGSISSLDLADRWRELVGDIPEAKDVVFTADLFSAGKDVDVQLVGNNLEVLRQAASELKQSLATIEGTYEISDTYQTGKREARLDLKPEAEAWGFTLADLALQVRQAFYGEEVQRIQRGRDDLRVMVRYPEEERKGLGDLENMRVRNAMGLEVPFSQVATFEEGRGYASIRRVDRNRAVSVTAAVDREITSPGVVLAHLNTQVLPQLKEKYPNLGMSFEGQNAEQRETMTTLFRGTALAFLVMYALLAIPLRSYLQPLLIMSAIPFGLVGAVWGHVFMGFNLTMVSFLGIVALAGVVINDSLVMVDFINRQVRKGVKMTEAIASAGVRRFRPILLTSLTTFVGLVPLLAEQSIQAKVLIPMAVSLAFGVLFATAITLVLVPAGYWVMVDMRIVTARIFGRRSRYDRQTQTEEQPVMVSTEATT